MSVNSLMARLGTSDPIEAYTSLKPLIDAFDFSKFSRSTPKFDPDELVRLNAKILHETPLSDVKDRLGEMGLNNIDENFWNAVRPNIEKLEDTKDWWEMTNDALTTIIDADDKDFIAQAATMLPDAPWDETTWKAWVGKIKEGTDRKGKNLFMPLRKALTGMEHGPELANLLPLLGPEKTKKRLAA